MSDYRLFPVNQLVDIDPDGSYIILFGVDNVPPHIGFVHLNKYYSKSSMGTKRGHELNKILTSVNRKGLPTVIIKLKNITVEPDRFYTDEALCAGQSCLTPIKNMLAYICPTLSNGKYLFDFLELLDSNNYIGQIEHLNCEGLIKNEELLLQKYTQTHIDRAILESKRPC